MESMSGKPEGWYTDPAPPHPGVPGTLRWWDGSGWTARTRGASRKELKTLREDLLFAQAVEAHEREQAAAEFTARHGVAPPAAPTAAPAFPPGSLPERTFTPDGQPLSGWWMRVAALLIDGVFTIVITAVLASPLIFQVVAGVQDYLTAAEVAQDPLVDQTFGQIRIISGIYLAVTLAYHIGFLKAMNATLGKRLLGLEVRLRERPGPLSWGTVLARVAGQNLGAVIGLLPIVGLLGTVYGWLDVLWPLWDGRRQALHDKIARTNVVRRS